MKKILLLIGLLGLAGLSESLAQDAPDGTWVIDFSTETWCADQTTICWTRPDSASTRNWLNGIRLVFEPQLGRLFHTGVNKFESAGGTGLETLDKFGVEVNLWKAWVALQASIVFPSVVEFDDQSPARDFLGAYGKTEADTGRRVVDVDHGWAVGLSLLDGVIALGFGQVNYDARDFNVDWPSYHRDRFFFFNIQPVSTLKKALKSQH